MNPRYQASLGPIDSPYNVEAINSSFPSVTIVVYNNIVIEREYTLGEITCE